MNELQAVLLGPGEVLVVVIATAVLVWLMARAKDGKGPGKRRDGD